MMISLRVCLPFRQCNCRIDNRLKIKTDDYPSGRVIERWTKFRSEKMIEGFVAGLAEENLTGNPGDIDQVLSNILDSESHSEGLFDAYRRICFAKSKIIGPRIVGYLTAKVIADGRMATSDEEEIFSAAEALGDADLIAFMKQYHEEAVKADQENCGLVKNEWEGAAIVIPWHEEEFATSYGSFEARDISPLDLGVAYGRWARELGKLGFMTTAIKRGFIDYENGGSDTYEFILRFESNCKLLSGLVVRCLPPFKMLAASYALNQ